MVYNSTQRALGILHCELYFLSLLHLPQESLIKIFYYHIIIIHQTFYAYFIGFWCMILAHKNTHEIPIKHIIIYTKKQTIFVFIIDKPPRLGRGWTRASARVKSLVALCAKRLLKAELRVRDTFHDYFQHSECARKAFRLVN
jgi:hypothetical protein